MRTPAAPSQRPPTPVVRWRYWVVLTCYITDKSRDFSTALRYARNDRTPDWNGNAYCARENLANTIRLMFLPEPCLSVLSV